MDRREGTGKVRKGRGMRLKAYYGCCPCLAVSTMFRGIGRFMFVRCYPVMQCTGLDEHRHRHHHPRRFNW